MKLITYRSGYDWACYDTALYYQADCPIGYAKTEFDAIVEFVRELMLRNGDAHEILVTCVPGARIEHYDGEILAHTRRRPCITIEEAVREANRDAGRDESLRKGQ